MGMLKEFKDFALRGNVVDMAVGVVIGAAFGKIVSSLVSHVIMPPLGYLLGGIDFSNLFIPLSDTPVSTLAEAKELGVPVIAYGEFLNAVIDFLIIAFVIFIAIKQINHFFPKAPPKEIRKCPYCKEAIADDATRCPHCTAVRRLFRQQRRCDKNLYVLSHRLFTFAFPMRRLKPPRREAF